MTQSLMETVLPKGDRDGSTYDRARDKDRLDGQHEAVWNVIRDGQWHTLSEIAQKANCQETSASARLRDCRKARYGGWDVERQYVGQGLWQYRVKEKSRV